MGRPRIINEETENINFRVEKSLKKKLKDIAVFKDGTEVSVFRRLINGEYEKVLAAKKRSRVRVKK